MESVRAYLLTVVGMAMLCGLVQMFLHSNSSIKPVVNLVTGVLLSVTVISPFVQGQAICFDDYFSEIKVYGKDAVDSGKIAAMNATSEIIKDRTQTYILDIASAFGASINAEVELCGESIQVPEKVTIKGTISPYTRKRISDRIERELGIKKEDQIWIS